MSERDEEREKSRRAHGWFITGMFGYGNVSCARSSCCDLATK